MDLEYKNKTFKIPNEVSELILNVSKERDDLKKELKHIKRQTVDTYLPIDILENYLEQKQNILKILIEDRTFKKQLLLQLKTLYNKAKEGILLFQHEYSNEDINHYIFLLNQI